MTRKKSKPPCLDGRGRDRGFSLVEVLVTIVILAIGLLGLAGLQVRAVTAQMESYQRSQALVLVKDMADRIETNRKNAAAYITATPRGTGFNSSDVLTCSGLAGSNLDLCEWHNSLLGAAETQGANKVGAMIGARGCIYQTTLPASGVATTYSIVVAWQGLSSTAAPDATTASSAGKCGFGEYKNRDNVPTEELHRVIALPIAIADLL